MRRSIPFFSAALVLVHAAAPAAQYAPAARELWSGTYRCGPMDGDRAYTASIRMRVENGVARIDKESSQIRETLTGQVAADGTLRLEGGGERKAGGGPGWRYRYEGRFEGTRFEADGAMLSSNLSTRLRDCTMTLARVEASGGPAARVKPAPEPEASPEPPPRQVAVKALPAAEPQAPATPASKPAAPNVAEREVSFNDRNDSAIMEGTVARGSPHRILVSARKDQTLTGTLKGEGARFDLYEPGSSITLLSGGFVVQGARLGATEEGNALKVAVPEDGRYLLVVRAIKDQAFYTLELAAGDGRAWYSLGRWKQHKWVLIALLAGAVALALALITRRRREWRLFRSG